MNSRYGIYVPAADYASSGGVLVERGRSSENVAYPFTTFPDTHVFASADDTKLFRDVSERRMPPEPAIDYDQRPVKRQLPRATYVPLPDYNQPTGRRSEGRIRGSRKAEDVRPLVYTPSIAVPVLPPMAPNLVSRPSGEVGAGQNRAWLHHVKNHLKFDTVHSYRTIDNCPICQSMDADTLAISKGRSYESMMTARRVKEPQSPIIEEPDDDVISHNMPSRRQATGVIMARALQDRISRKSAELTIFQGELLEVLEPGKHWCKCCNMSGDVGWVPVIHLRVIKTTH